MTMILPSLEVSGTGTFAAATSPLRGPPAAGAKSPRRNPPNTEFRRFYERGDLPCKIDPRAAKRRLLWHVPLEKLDLAHFLPLLLDGLREEEYPYCFVAQQGARELIRGSGARLLPVIPALIGPLRQAINTRRPGVMLAAVDALHELVLSDSRAGPAPVVGRALVPYYRQLLPVLNIFVAANLNLGDGIEYGQRKGDVLGDRIEELLNVLEVHGGEDAFVNLRYLVPTYQSCLPAAAAGRRPGHAAPAAGGVGKP